MQNIEYYQLFILIAQCLVVASFLLLFFRLRTIFGLGLFYIAIGLFKFMHYFFTQAFSVEIAQGIYILIGPTVITPAILFSLLLIYIREDAGEVRKIIYALIFFNFFFAIMLRISELGINGAGFVNKLNLPEHFFRMDISSLIAGSLVLFIDGIVLIVLYEFISKKIKSLFFRIFLTMTSVLFLHALIFNSVAFIFKPLDTSVLQGYAISILISKAIPISVYTVSFWLYLVYFEKRSAISKQTGSSFRDVFNLLTYRQKYALTHNKLKESEKKFRTLVEESPVGIFLDDSDGNATYINNKCAELVGVPMENALNMDWIPYIHNDDRDRVTRSWTESITKGKRFSEDYRWVHPDGKVVWTHGDIAPVKDNKENVIVYIGTLTNITERKQAEEKLKAANQQLEANYQQLIATEQALRESEEKFRLAFHYSPDSVNITRLSDGKLLEASNSFEKITGHKLSDALGKKTSDLNLWANPGDRDVMKEKLSKDGKIENFEFIRKMKNGYKAFSVMSAAIITINNEPHLLSVIRDIDDLKKAGINIRESEARLKEAEVIANMGNFTWDINTGDVIWSDGLHELLGYDKSKKLDYNKVNAEIHHPDDLERITAWLNECIASGKSNFPPNEYRLLRKDGKVIHVQTSVKVQSEDNVPLKMFGTIHDITERKQAEESLRQSEERYRQMLNTSLDGFILADEDGKILQINPSYCKMIGYSEQELLSMNIRNIEAKLSDQEVKERIQQMVSQGKARFETRHRAKDGHFIDLDVSISILKIDKKTPLVAAFVRDITERKLAEEALKESELKFQKIISESLEAISVVDEEGKIIVWNTALEKITGIKSTETVDHYIWDVQAELVDKVESNSKRKDEVKSTLLDILKTGEAPWLNKVMEREYVHSDGTIKMVSGSMYTIKTQKGYLIVSISEDVTERKQSEKALKEAHSNLQALLDNRRDSIWALDRNYNFLVYNKPYADVIFSNMGVRLEKGMNALEIHPKEVNDFWKPKFDEVFKGKYVTFEFSYPLEGKEHFFEVLMNPIYTDNKVSGLSALSMDITERKQAEQEISKLTTAVTQSPSIIAITDMDGKLEYVNPKFIEVTGYSQEELIGHNPRILQSGEHSAEMYKELWETILSGKIWQGEFHNKKKNGELFWESASISPIFDEKGKIINYLKDSEDITESKQAEVELRKYQEHLQELVKERTSELEKTLKEVERMNKLFVGREFRIKELKDEIKLLKDKLNK